MGTINASRTATNEIIRILAERGLDAGSMSQNELDEFIVDLAITSYRSHRALLATNQDLVAQLAADHERNESRLAEAQTHHDAEHRAYKQHVANIAMDYAVRHGWCDTVKDALAEMDIKLDEPSFTAEITVVYKVVGQVSFDHAISFRDQPERALLGRIGIPSIVSNEDSEVFALSEGEPTSVRVTAMTMEGSTLATQTTEITEIPAPHAGIRRLDDNEDAF